MAVMLIVYKPYRRDPNVSEALDEILNANDHRMLDEGIYLLHTNERLNTMYDRLTAFAKAKDFVFVTMLKQPFRMYSPRSVYTWAVKKMKERKQAPAPPETPQSISSRRDSRKSPSIDSFDDDIPF
jgi:hypothetical protein